MPHKLLLADDSVTMQRVIELTFAGEDVEVIAVGDGQKAIDRISTDRPDIVLTDIGMPERNGYEVAEFVKTHPDLKHIPVVLLTGAFEAVDEARVRAIGCDGWLVKPFEPQLVINRVRDLLGLGAPWTQPSGQRPSSKGQAAEQPRDVPAAPPPAAPERPPASTAARPSPAPAVRAMASAPTSVARPPKPADAMEEYFDRLDAAFANLETTHASQSDDRQVEDGRDQELHRGEPSGSQKPGEELENWDVETVATDESAPQTSDLAAASDSDRAAAAPTEPRVPSVQPAPAAPPVRQASSAPPVPSVRRAPATPPAPTAPPAPLVKETAQSPQPAHAPGRVELAPAPIAEPAPAPISVPTPSLADAFTALLAAEQRIPDWSGTTQPRSQAGAPALPDGLVEELTRRVLDGATDQAVRDVVADTVSQVAERLVRDEIERIKTRGK